MENIKNNQEHEQLARRKRLMGELAFRGKLPSNDERGYKMPKAGEMYK